MSNSQSTPPDDCPLSVADQTRNVLIVAVNTALSYLAAPAAYVDSIHTALIDDLQNAADVQRSNALSNLPATAYMVFTVMPILVAWAFPQIRLLRRIVATCYFLMAAGSAAVVFTLLSPAPWWIKASVVIGHGALMGATRTVGVAIEFEVLGVAVAPSRRGQALGLAYGVGPLLGAAGNLVAQLLLQGAVSLYFFQVHAAVRPFPENFAFVFGCTIPVFALAALLSSQLVVPLPPHDVQRQPFVIGVFGGMGQFLRRRVTLLAVVSAIAIFSGYQILGNMTLYGGLLLGGKASDYAGYQKAILYSCKFVMGVSMGWLLSRASPRSAVLASSLVGLSAVLWALVAPPAIFLLSFGVLGAGQLYGIYITNYVLCAAPKHLMRRYMAFMMLTGLPTAPAGYFFGKISDYFGERYSNLVGFQASFVAAAAVIVFGIALSLLLPSRPSPDDRPADVDTPSTVG